MNQKKCDVGWMYHLMPIRKKRSPTFAPPISQIPVMGLTPELKCDIPANTDKFRPTDTSFIRLCKMGGRKDLLCFRENDPNRGYTDMPPRCEWFYLEDNGLNDLSKGTEKEEYVFKVPCYMTHKPVQHRKLPTPIPQTSPPPLPKRPKARRNKLNDDRPGYAEYNKRLNKVGIAYREYHFPNPIQFPKKMVPDQPNSMQDLLANKYLTDYDEYQKQWKEVNSLLYPRASCVPKGPTVTAKNTAVRKHRKRY